MSTKTTNHNLNIDNAGTDHPNRAKLLENFNIIDAALGKFADLPTTAKTSLVLALKEIYDALKAVTDGSSGADYIGMTPITEAGAANKIQTVIEALITRIKAVTNGASGADLVGITPIADTGEANTVQSVIEALITKFKAITNGSSGADMLGATPVVTGGGNTVQSNMEAIYAAIVAAALGQIPDDSLTEAKMDPEMKKQAGGVAPFDTVATHLEDSAIYASGYAGVDKTGATDSSAGFQLAVNAAKALKGKLIVSPGTYIISGITIDESLIVEGFGEGSIIKAAVGSANIFNISGTGKKVIFRNLIIDGNYQNQAALSTNVCINSESVGTELNPTIIISDHCIFKNVNYGALYIYGDNTDAGKTMVTVTNSQFLDAEERASDPNSVFIRAFNKVDCLIENSYFNGNTDGYTSTVPPYGIVGIVLNSNEATPDLRKFGSLTILNNEFRNMGSNNFGVIDFYIKAEKVNISGNKIINCYTGAIRGKTNSKEITISYNKIYKNKENGIILTAWTGEAIEITEQDIIVEGNIIDICEDYGIIMSGWDADLFENNIISQNIIKNCGGSGIYMDRCSNTHISYNIIKEVTIGIQVYACDNKSIDISHNKIKNAVVTAGTKGIYVDDLDATVANYAEDVDITSNQIYNMAASIYLSRCKGLCNISNNAAMGATTTGAIVIRKSTGIFTLAGNTCKDITARDGISIYDTNTDMDVKLIGNTIENAGTYGMYLKTIARLIMEGNEVNVSATGYYLGTITRAIITGNNSQGFTSAEKTYQTIAELVDASNSWNGFTSVA
jgi:parallel beta-helix repeat protein